MGYFRELPELDYQSFLSDSNSSSNYLRVKNLFRRCKLRDDLQSIFTLFNKYEIVEGARPDTVAEELYGDAELDWVVLMTAGIINVRNEWPLSDRQIYNYSLLLEFQILTLIPQQYLQSMESLIMNMKSERMMPRDQFFF